MLEKLSSEIINDQTRANQASDTRKCIYFVLVKFKVIIAYQIIFIKNQWKKYRRKTTQKLTVTKVFIEYL